MAAYKVNCKIDKGDGKGIIRYPLYIKEALDEAEAERYCKYYFLEDNPQIGCYYGIFDVKKI